MREESKLPADWFEKAEKDLRRVHILTRVCYPYCPVPQWRCDDADDQRVPRWSQP